MRWNTIFNLVHQPRTGDSDLSTRLHKASEVVQVEIVCSEVGERIDADDGVKEVDVEWQ